MARATSRKLPEGTKKESAEEQRNMIMATFFDENDEDGSRSLALCEHCRIDLAACDGDTKKLPNVIFCALPH